MRALFSASTTIDPFDVGVGVKWCAVALGVPEGLAKRLQYLMQRCVSITMVSGKTGVVRSKNAGGLVD